MPIVKLGKSRQVTLPKWLIEEMNLQVGDYFELQHEGDRIVLIPKTLVEKNQARARLSRLLNQAWEANRDRDPQEIEAAIEQAISEVRTERRTGAVVDP
ncbi:MAG TPA: AbrB/MazE/SpoVT family DNA-binding domain-containing protein [Candidatus Fraserbacteria bacterium]|nr:AbrB/MazE/SpoVT family DNA-binding domain-containing protein [Candidatus Fraserbacteria bacterium]